MEPIIYELPKTNIIELEEAGLVFDARPSPKLIKYGFNKVNEKLDFMNIISSEHYRTALKFDFDRTDKQSIASLGKKSFGAAQFDQIFAEFWEVLNLFGMLSRDQKILSNYPDTLRELVMAHQKMAKSKSKISVFDKSPKDKMSIVIKNYSAINIDEDASFQLIFNDLPELISIQAKGSIMVLQIFSIQTRIMAELVHYLGSLYDDAYMMKPAIVPDISDSKYLILSGLKEAMKVSIPRYPGDVYIASIIPLGVPGELDTTIQCMNSETIPKKILAYFKIQKYIDGKIYEGMARDELIRSQDANAQKWLELYTNLSKMESLFLDSLDESKKRCDKYTEWNQLVGQI